MASDRLAGPKAVSRFHILDFALSMGQSLAYDRNPAQLHIFSTLMCRSPLAILVLASSHGA